MARKVGYGGVKRDGDAKRGDVKSRAVPAVFLTIWLVLWTVGIFYVAAALTGEIGAETGVGSLMMVVWLVLAVIGWLFAFRTLRRILRGEPALRSGGPRPPHPDAGNPYIRSDHDDH